ncbi:MAG: NAD(P)/FAD-dependent oxidoreductase [Acidimicrobiia bacterium]
MPTLDPIQPLPADDDALRAALADCELAPLLAAVAHLTGDLSLLRDELRPAPGAFMQPATLTPEQQAAVVEVAFGALVRWRDAGMPPAPATSEADLVRLMEFAIGETPDRMYLGLLEEELEPGGVDLRAPQWTKGALAPDRDFRVAIIGAGMSGLLTAHRLQQAGVDFVIIEKNDDVGGTWWENTYPGCRVDVPNHLYSYSFAQRADWEFRFTPQKLLIDYFREVADDFGLREHIRFGTEVASAAYDEATEQWHLALRGPSGEETLVADALVSAVGQLNRPRYPDIDGRASFAGPSFHSARWDDSVDLAGKRVAVIGTAASAVQLMPHVSDRVGPADGGGELLIFQRSPNWISTNPQYTQPLPAGVRWMATHVPGYLQWYRFTLFWGLTEGGLPACRVDPAWNNGGKSVSEINDLLRQFATAGIEAELADRPDLLAVAIPPYPPMAKRMLIDDGRWWQTLKADTTTLVTDHIARITPTGVVTVDDSGVEVAHEVDVIIYATGFQASDFLLPMQVTGAGGVDLHQWWADNPRAYLGVTIPHFPKLFCLYGPNTNIVANGSIIFFSECGARYAVDCIRLLLETGSSRLDLREDVLDAFSQHVDEGNANMAWGASDAKSWYKNRTGKVTQNWPFNLVEYWERTRAVDPTDYSLT